MRFLIFCVWDTAHMAILWISPLRPHIFIKLKSENAMKQTEDKQSLINQAAVKPKDRIIFSQ